MKGFTAKRLLTLSCLSLSMMACSTANIEPPAKLTSINQPVKIEKAWSISVGDDIPLSSGEFRAAIDAETLAAASVSGRVVLVDRKSGAKRWQIELGTPLNTGVSRDKSQLYVASTAGEVIALSVEDGEELWRQRFLGDIISLPAAGLGRVWIRTTDGELAALDASTGEKLWSGSIPPPSLTIRGQGEPLLVQGGALVGFADGRVLALGGADGRRLWSSTVAKQSGQTEVERLSDVDGPLAADQRFAYAASYQGRVVKIDPGNGDIVWSQPISTSTGVFADKNAVYVSDDEGAVWAFSKQDGTVIWKQEAMRLRKLSGVKALGDYIAVADYKGYIQFLSKDTGDIVGRIRTDSDGLAGALTATTDRLYAQGRNGLVYSIIGPQ